jgi:hypothetical protein
VRRSLRLLRLRPHRVPNGPQIVGRTYPDLSVFRTASAYERARSWLDTPAPAYRADGISVALGEACATSPLGRSAPRLGSSALGVDQFDREHFHRRAASPLATHQ